MARRLSRAQTLARTDWRWVVVVGGGIYARAPSRKAAMNRVDRPWVHSGDVAVENTATGERWVRKFGSWFKEAKQEAAA